MCRTTDDEDSKESVGRRRSHRRTWLIDEMIKWYGNEEDAWDSLHSERDR